MKKLLVLATLLTACCSTLLAQKVAVDKQTGLVTVDDKEAFYLSPKNKSFMQSDYALENLQHEELAYLKYEEVVRYSSRGEKTASDYLMVFTQSGNQCYITEFNIVTGVMRSLAKAIAGANLVKDGKVAAHEERKFVTLHNGTFARESAAAVAPERTVVVPGHIAQPTAPADISLKDNNIYNHSELVGVFKRSVNDNISTISVYNVHDVLVCSASHEDGNDHADWHIKADGRSVDILYKSAAPLEQLFKFLVEKGML